ncbi:hypothetical protein MUDAN_DOGOELCO_03374 [Lactiplantibacillus mudanjiangensis]|uniref:hypothetical protein n=1 Tax=Lactiplantibacillus mudanjiangensis TaxID=1296538 RepID=UPI001014829B|nr:hypothetical protein [Lactiplantibacillus mudanjiangensis]VDG31529.1 hypothetical protein MUDAN_DOGOELCO_03374 [Lactiplantibacillus mudanjiangensis]
MTYEFTFYRSNWKRLRDEKITIAVNQTLADQFYEIFSVSNNGWDKSFAGLHIEVKEEDGFKVDGKFKLYSVVKIPERIEPAC